MPLDVRSPAKKIGRFAFALAVLPGGTLYASDTQISLSLLSTQGMRLSSIIVGKTFSLNVTVKNGTVRSAPRVEGLGKFHILGQSSRTMHTQSGTTVEEELTIQYTLVADAPGTFTLGPARFNEFPGKEAAPVTIEVLESQSNKKNEMSEPTLTLKIDKTDVYVGEKVPFSLRFAWQEPELKPIHLEMPDLQDAQIKEVQRGQRTERIGDQVYNIIEFTGLLYPERAGLLRIPQLRADYTRPQEERRWSTFFPFAMQERDSTFSRPVRINVHELPPTDKPVIGVGNLKRLAATISAQEIPRGEAGTLVLSLQGDADFSGLKAPTPLLPQSFRQYPSKTTLDKSGSGIQWSYVIQGLEEGTFTLPAQEVTFFDTQSKSYKTLKSQPLSVTITPGTTSLSTTVTLPVQEEAEEPLSLPEEEPTQKKAWLPMLPQIPMGWFILLMLMPVMMSLGMFLWRLASPLTEHYSKRRRSLKALDKARKQLLLLEKKGDRAQVHEVMKQALATCFDLDDPTDANIDNAMRMHSYDDPLRVEVAQFLQDAVRVSPYAEKPSLQTSKDLFKDGNELLNKVRFFVKAFIVACVMVQPLQAFSVISLTSHLAETLGVIPFVVWQVGVLIGWWVLWWVVPKISSELRYALVLLWLCFLCGWALRLPKELYPAVRVTKQVHLYVGPSENYPTRAVLEPDDELVLVKIDGAWYYISSLKGKGWVPAAFIEKK